MSALPYAPKVKLTTLWQRRSAKTGKTYFSGFLANARIIVLKDERADVPDGADGIWSVFVEEKQEREGSSSERRPMPRSEPVGEGGVRIDTRPPRPSASPSSAPDFDDDIPFGSGS